MRYSAPAVLAALSFALVSCSDSNTPITQEQADEALATSVSGAGVDPNAETTSGHTATPPAPTCSWNATTMWSTCTGTNNGLTITRQMQFLNASGAQQRPDSTTTSMRSKTTVTGTTSFTNPNGGPTITTTVNRTSDETVTGFGKNSTQRVVNGTASGTEHSTGSDARGEITVARTYADTTSNLTLPPPPPTTAQPPGPVFPLSGTITRNMSSSVKVNDGAPKDFSSREVQTFEAGGKLTVTTTVNGRTRTCVFQLGTRTAPTCTP